MIKNLVRKNIGRYITKQKEIVFRNQVPPFDLISEKFRGIDSLGIYLHIPFCNQICPYCPYNKELFNAETASRYAEAVIKEVNSYIPVMGNKPVTSFYIGGGTPTTMLDTGIDKIIHHIYKHLDMHCSVHMESHPNHLSVENLYRIEAMGVKYLSIGVESLQDRHLKAIHRTYNAAEVKKAVERAVSRNFECVNADYIFDLPGQTIEEIEQDSRNMVNLGVDQVATYPLFRFPYSGLGPEFHKNRNATGTMFRRRKFLQILENTFYGSGFGRSSVWAFTKKGTEKYCSVTVPLYLGLGASGSSYLNDIFYVNTFNVTEYINAIETGKSPISLSIDLTDEMQMAGWLYWRLYETRFRKSDFNKRFGSDFDQHYGKMMKLLNHTGLLNYNGDDRITLTDKGSYWIHAFEDFFSIDYITKLWGTLKNDPWPDMVEL
jgi:coproporphyrinogen III oxidase-like Fe-S oxidoreductase